MAKKKTTPSAANPADGSIKEAQTTPEATQGETPEATQDNFPKTLEELDALVEELESELAFARKERNEAARAAELKASAEAEKNDKRPVFTDDRGLQWRFKKDAPKTLNAGGKPQKTKDLVKNKEVMMELVYGNSNFIERKLV